MMELYPGEYADLQDAAQGECEAATRAAARLAALPPGTPAYAAADADSYYCDLAAGHALWNLEQFEQAHGLPLTPLTHYWQMAAQAVQL